VEYEKLEILKKVFGAYTKAGSEYLFSCPKCDHHKRKLSISLEKNVWKCWICDYAGHKLHRLVRKWGTYEDKKEWSEVDNEYEISNFKMIFKNKLLNGNEEEVYKKDILNLPDDYKTLVTKHVSFDSLEARNFLTSRGVTREDIFKWKIGYCKIGEYRKRIIVPSFDEGGNINFFIGRSYTDDWMKYKNPNVQKDIVFNSLFIDWTSDLVLVEGIFDAFKANNAVPILGSSLREDSVLFQTIVSHDTPVFLALDHDVEKKAMSLIKRLIQYDIELYKIDTSGYKDIAEMSNKIFEERKVNAIKFDNKTYLEYMILNKEF